MSEKGIYAYEHCSNNSDRYVTIGGKSFGFSKDGKYWTEKIEVECGDKIYITWLENGRHFCQIERVNFINSEGLAITTPEYGCVSDDEECEVCKEILHFSKITNNKVRIARILEACEREK